MSSSSRMHESTNKLMFRASVSHLVSVKLLKDGLAQCNHSKLSLYPETGYTEQHLWEWLCDDVGEETRGMCLIISVPPSRQQEGSRRRMLSTYVKIYWQFILIKLSCVSLNCQSGWFLYSHRILNLQYTFMIFTRY